MSEKRVFSSGNDRIDRLRNDPEFAADIREVRERREKAREAYRAERIGHRLAVVRRSMRLTQKDVAARMGVTQGRVSQIEKGTVFDTTVLKAYVEALGGRMHTTLEIGDELIRVA
jgi:DNA-binding XRE family transcriptional regulator